MGSRGGHHGVTRGHAGRTRGARAGRTRGARGAHTGVTWAWGCSAWGGGGACVKRRPAGLTHARPPSSPQMSSS
eukprot:850695-Prymnesium_polylepis.1